MSKLSYYITLLRAIFPSIYVCFKYLPFKQAVKLPILIYKPHDCCFKGHIRIEAEKIYRGMITLGFNTEELFANNGISLKNEGNITFKGSCQIRNDNHVHVGQQGHLVLGDNFRATSGIRIACMHSIYFGKDTLLGWRVIVTDSNFHPLYDREKKEFKKAYSKIHISDNNWFALDCVILPGVTTPDHCVFGARSVVTRNGHYESYCVHAGNPAKVLTRNVERIVGQDFIKDYK